MAHRRDLSRSAICGADSDIYGMFASHHFTSFPKWKDFVHDSFPWLEHRKLCGRAFAAQVCSRRLGGCSLSMISASASEVIRTQHLVESSDCGLVKMIWQTSGALKLEQDGRDCTLLSGQVAVCDTGRPYRISLSDDAAFLVLMVPYEWILGWGSRGQRLTAERIGDGLAVRAAIGAMLGASHHPPEGLTDPDVSATLDFVRRMLSTAFGRNDDSLPVSRLSPEARVQRARAVVAGRIADPRLSIDDIAASLCMSRRSLYLLFEAQDESPADMIRSMRLEKAAKLLRDRSCARRKITDIAFDCGFRDYATFSRLFKSRYGAAPVSYRECTRAVPAWHAAVQPAPCC